MASKKRNGRAETAEDKHVVTVRLSQGELDNMQADMDSMPVRPSKGSYVKAAIAAYPKLRKLHDHVKAQADGGEETVCDVAFDMLREAGL